MKFILYGAGALGSLFGGLLSRCHNVLLIGREEHINAIFKHGLKIEGITNEIFYPNVEWDGSNYDLMILTVKAYDTEKAMEQAIKKFGVMPVLSLQNGLRNEDIIEKFVGRENTIGGVTSHGVTFISPGKIRHAGKGVTIIGGIGKNEIVENIANAFNECGIETKVSKNIKKEIWRKTIINSAINSLTTILKCKNGELIKYENLIKKICSEGMEVAKIEGYSINDAFEKTMHVITNTKNNYSSMLQDIMNKKRTEINEINGEISRIAELHGIHACYNSVLTEIIKEMENVGT